MHAAQGLQAPVLMDAVHGPEASDMPEDVQALLRNIFENDDRERFFLHAASLDVPRFDISVSSAEPAFWRDILDLLD